MDEAAKAQLVERLRSIVTLAQDVLATLEQHDILVSSDAGFTAPAPPAPVAPAPPPAARRKIAWGAKVSPVFRDRIWWIADQLGLDPDDLMSCIAWESGETFSPSVKNQAGSGATGLIQFMPTTAKGLGTTTAELAKMTAENQLNYVYKYFRPWAGKLKTLSDVYMAILWPKAVGEPESYEIFFEGTTAFRQNAGLDVNKNGRVTKSECAVKVLEKKQKGLRGENMA